MWLIVGLVAGFLASWVMRGRGYGLIGDSVVGGIAGRFRRMVDQPAGVGDTSSLLGSIVIAFIGACVLIAILHAVSGGTCRRRA